MAIGDLKVLSGTLWMPLGPVPSALAASLGLVPYPEQPSVMTDLELSPIEVLPPNNLKPRVLNGSNR